MYDGLVGSVFKFIHCWFILCNESKWQAHLTTTFAPNAGEHKEVVGGQAEEANKDVTLPPKISRPIGRDKAKKMRSSSTSSNSTACLEVLQSMRSDQQAHEERVEQATGATEDATAARSERKLAIQEQQLVLQERMLRVQEEREENLVMTIDLDKMTPWARDYYIMKQKEIVEKRAGQQSSTNAE
jgi:hypothetical protein